MEIVPGVRISVEPEKLVAGGDALCRVDGLPVFVAAVYPGDRAEIEITETRKGFARGRLVNLERPSPTRRSQCCPVANTCGGCDWTELRLDAQLRAKRQILVESLVRTGRLDRDSIPAIRVYPSPLRYRVRTRLHRDADGHLGFFGRGSHDVVPLPEECEIVGPRLLAALASLGGGSVTGDVLSFETGGSIVIHDAGDEPEEVTWRMGPEVSGLGALSYRLASDSFFQVNRHLLGSLITRVIEIAGSRAGRELALDLYAGIGFFSVPLARRFSRVIAIEENPDAVRYAELNLAESDAEVIGGRVELVLAGLGQKADFVMVDPPRAGLDRRAIDEIDRVANESVCYLSCDPVTFSRDVSRFARLGWSLSSLDLFDLFPNTHHIETLASLVRATNQQSKE